MTEAIAVAKRWGSSIGIVIPKDIVEKEHIREHDKVRLTIAKARTARRIWGLLPGLRTDAQKAKDDMRKGWD